MVKGVRDAHGNGMAEQQGEGSQSHTEILAPLGARSHRCVNLGRFVISPYDRRYRVWETFLVLLALYTAWVFPFEFGFMDGPRKPLCIIDNVVNGFFGVDIILTFFVAYLDKTTNLLVDEPKKIAKKYVLSLKMVFDVVSMIPFGVAQKIYHGLIHAYGLYNMLRLWRLRRVGQLFARMEKDRNLDYFWVQCVKFICVALFAVHCVGCFCYHIAAHDRESSMEDFLQFNIWTIGYVMSVYWVIINLITVGYCDMHPVNKWFDVLYMFFNFDLASLRGNMTNLVVHISNQTRQYRNSIQAENQGADLDAPKTEGWTPRDLTERQGQEEIKTPFQLKTEEPKPQPVIAKPEKQNEVKRFTSDPTLRHMVGQHIRLSWSPNIWSPNSFGNSTSGQVWVVRVRQCDVYPARVVLICPEKGGLKIFAPLPNSFKKLLGVCADKLGFLPYKILTEWGTQIDCIEEIDDDDRLVVVSSMTEWENFLSSLNY